MAPAKRPIPEGFPTVTPVLTHNDCAAALDWYVKALGAVEVSRSLSPEGKIMHSEFRVGNSPLLAHDALMGGKGPADFGGSPAALWVYVEDCDSLFGRAVSAGAAVIGPVVDQFWGDRCGTFKDPHGYAWTICTRVEDLTAQEIDARAAEFFRQMTAGGPGAK
jgi:PhnB protein